jgi:hypothetical protein
MPFFHVSYPLLLTRLIEMTTMLAKLFGSVQRIKILRLFLLNPEKILDQDAVVRRSKVLPKDAKKELAMLAEIQFIKMRARAPVDDEKKEGEPKRGWQLNQSFPFIYPLKLLLVNTVPFTQDEIVRRLRSVGRLKLIVTSGIFIQNEDSRTDLLLVGDDIKKGALEHAIKLIEAEVGRELNYGVFETEDFKYRFGVYDKFIRDVLDYPHEKIYDKIGLSS